VPKTLASAATLAKAGVHKRRERPITALVRGPVPSLDARMFTTFRGGRPGQNGEITALSPVKGDALPPVTAISITSGAAIRVAAAGIAKPRRVAEWASHLRYAERAEKVKLEKRRAGLGRRGHLRGADPDPEITAGWDLTQEERRSIFEEQVAPHRSTLKILPAIARQLIIAATSASPSIS